MTPIEKQILSNQVRIMLFLDTEKDSTFFKEDIDGSLKYFIKEKKSEDCCEMPEKFVKGKGSEEK